jgi:hypothetical protein
MQTLEIILDITIIILLLLDILLYGVIYNKLEGVIALVGYTYLYLSNKDEDYAANSTEEDD